MPILPEPIDGNLRNMIVRASEKRYTSAMGLSISC